MRKHRPTDLRWREDPLLWVAGLIMAVVIVISVVLVTHQQSAQIDCVPGYHVHHGKCVKD